MPAVFLTTPALEIYLLWRQCRMAKFLDNLLANEVWVSPVSHAILDDTYVQAGPSLLTRRGRREVEHHRRRMETAGSATYPMPTLETLRVWREIRSVQIDIPAYSDGEVEYPAQKVGPDELLVFATAAAFSKPLIGPAPTDSTTLDYLEDLGIEFHRLDTGQPDAGPPIPPPDVELDIDELIRAIDHMPSRNRNNRP